MYKQVSLKMQSKQHHKTSSQYGVLVSIYLLIKAIYNWITKIKIKNPLK